MLPPPRAKHSGQFGSLPRPAGQARLSLAGVLGMPGRASGTLVGHHRSSLAIYTGGLPPATLSRLPTSGGWEHRGQKGWLGRHGGFLRHVGHRAVLKTSGCCGATRGQRRPQSAPMPSAVRDGCGTCPGFSRRARKKRSGGEGFVAWGTGLPPKACPSHDLHPWK